MADFRDCRLEFKRLDWNRNRKGGKLWNVVL